MCMLRVAAVQMAAAGRVLLVGLYAVFYLLDGVLCQDERPLSCYQMSSDCTGGNEMQLPYSQCCVNGSAGFTINGTCYQCSDLLSFTAETYQIREGARYISVGVERRVNPGTDTFFFSAVINDGSAKAGIDYGQFPDSGVGFIHIILGEESLVGAGIVILDDNIVEYNENFTVSLQPLSSSFRPLGDDVQDSAEVIIIDDDMVDITLSPPGPLTVNESSSLLFLLSKTGLADRPVQVILDISDPELEFGDGAQPSIRTFTFEPNDPAKVIEVVVRDDTIVEATEDHVIYLRVPEGETGVNLPRDSETLRVQDDGDTIQLSLSGADTGLMTVEESQGVIRVPLLKSGVNERPVLVRVFTGPLTATAGEDYSSIDAVLEVQDTGDILISINVSGDGAVEDMETFNLRVSVPEGETGVVLDTDTAIITIADSDFLTVEVGPEALSVAEGESVSLLVTGRGATLQRNVTISINSPSNNRDITLSATTVTLTPGQLESSVTVTGFDDDLYEGAESAQLVITSSDQAVRLSSSVIDVEIIDSDSPQLSFSQDVYSVEENQTTAQISVSFGAPTETSHLWTLTSVPLSATEGADYSPISRVLTFSDTVRTEDVVVGILDDLLSEGIESFRLELRDTSGTLTASSIVEILDNEKLEISFTNESVVVSEGDVFFYLTIVKSGVTASDITIDLIITDGTAQGGIDYGFFPTTVFPAVTLILADETSVRFPIPITNDDIIENTETFSVALLIRNVDGTIIPGEITRTIVLIEDDDKLRVFLGGGGVEVAEGGSEAERTVQFTVSRDGNATLNRDVLVTLSTADDSATVATGDYEAKQTTFTFTPTGALSFTETVRVLDDVRVENRERFSVALSPPVGETALSLPDRNSVVYITDNDNIQVDFGDIVYTVTESDGVATVFLSKTGENEIPVTVSVVTETRDDTAVAGRDYNATIEPVEFAQTQTQVPILIPILNDGALEGEERFTVVLSTTGTDENVILGPRNTAQVTITDDDSVFVEFTAAVYSGREGEDVSVTVSLRGSSERRVEVGFTSRVGTADESDFSPQSGTVTFFPGEDSKSFLVLLTQDIMCDDKQESFSLVLEISDPNVGLGPISATEVFIVDDDECTIQFMNDTMVMVTEEEEDSQITLCIGLSGNFILDRAVRFAVVAEELTNLRVDQQALSGVDFAFDPIFRVLLPSESQICFNVTILGDDRRQDLKKFNVSVFPEEEELRSSRAEVTVVIQSEITPPPPTGLPTVEFSREDYSVTENEGFVEIMLTISPPPSDTQFLRSVFFSTADGSATAPDDYISQMDTIVTIEGSSAIVLVEIVEDSETEGEESFSVFLRLPDGVIVERVRLGDLSSATVTISDAGGVFVEDTVTGDPFFIVPLSLTPNSHTFQENQVALCYEIHGMPGETFNLVSDTCTSVNALYSISSVNPELNFISDIGIRAVDMNRNCIDIRVSVAQNCTPEIRRGNDDIIVTSRFDGGRVSVRKSGPLVRISVPNCGSRQLVMSVRCREVNAQPQLRFDIMRGANLSPTSHGLLGQFWNIPVHVTPYNFPGPVTYDLQAQELYQVDILSPTDSEILRQFVAEFSPRSWDHNRPESCLYAGDQQGGRTLEFSSPNDAVIENNYRLYKTGGLFSTRFLFSKFNETICGSS